MRQRDKQTSSATNHDVPNILTLMAGTVLLFIAGFEWHWIAHIHFFQYDYAFFYYAFRHVLTHQASFHSLYNIGSQMSYLHHLHNPLNPNDQYVYPPQFAVLFSPLGLLPFRVSAALWTGISVLAYYGGITILIRVLWGHVQGKWLLPLFMIATAFAPFTMDIAYGNINSVLFFLIVLGFTLHHQKKSRLAGAVLALTIMMKVTPAAVLFVPLLRREWRLILWSALTVLGATVITAFVVGVGPIVQYALHFLSFGQTSMGNGPAPYNQSIVGVVGLLQLHGWMFGGKWLQDIVYLVFIGWALRAVIMRVTRSAASDWRLDMALASLCPLLFSPLDEQMHMLLALPALLVIARMGTTAHFAAARSPASARMRLSATVAAALMSLPAMLGCAWIADHWPALAWTQTQMFAALVITATTVFFLYSSTKSRAVQKRWTPHSDAAPVR